MPDLAGFPTVRELELGLEITKLKRENEQLRSEQAPTYANLVEPVKECRQVVPTLTRHLNIIAKAGAVYELGCVRITAECYSSDGTFHLADYVSDDLFAQAIDPFEYMMALHRRVLEMVARRQIKAAEESMNV